jgi:hypothetical protein
VLIFAFEALEGLIIDGWVKAELDESQPLMPFVAPQVVFEVPAQEVIKVSREQHKTLARVG